ncbi:MAG: 50S ribosomal protein L24 [Planctomycetota bacterium]
MHVKKGDTVQIIAGDHKGASGKVLRVYPKKGKVIVQGHNIAKKHVRKSQRNPQGGRIDVEQPIDISNVLPLSTKSSKGGRLGYKINDDGSKQKVFKDGSKAGFVRRAK